MAKKWNKLVARLEALEDAFAELLSGKAAAKRTKRKKTKKAAPAKRKNRKAPAPRKAAAMTVPRKAATKPARKKRKPRILAAAAASMIPQAPLESL